MRLRIDLAYDGTGFRGWAAQPGLRSIEGELTLALATVLRVGDKPRVVVAGRTDAGVHARGQVVHTDLPDELGLADDATRANLLRRLNGILPAEISVRRVAPAPPGFDARYAALWRRYVYRIADQPTALDPLRRTEVLTWPRPLDLDVMNEAATALLGRHDFASFCRRREGATTIRTLLDLHWTRDATGLALATVRADAFCHSMVRALVGCLISVGEHRRDPAWAEQVMVALARHPAVTVAQAHGLTLEEVAYPDDDALAARAAQTRARRTL